MEIPKLEENEAVEKHLASLQELTKLIKCFRGLEHLHSFFKMIDPLNLEE